MEVAMGLLDSNTGAVRCPACGTWGAKKSLWKVKCRNISCNKFDAEYAAAYQQSRAVGKPATQVFTHLKGKADPAEYSLQIRYKNFRGDELTYSADPRSAYRRGEYVVVRLTPTGKRVSFKLSSIQNSSEVETILGSNSQPSGNERRILKYHLRKGSSSALFEELRQKFPNYHP
jgi:hypothetical protein